MGQSHEPLTKNNWIEEQIKIPDIKTVENEIDLRIFLDRGFTNKGRVVRIFKNGSSWTANKYEYFLRIKKGNVTEKIGRWAKSILISKNLDSLWTRLEKLNILTLPNQDDIKDKLRKEVMDPKRGKGYKHLMVFDGSSYDLVIKNSGSIRTYSFHSPWIYSEEFPDVLEVKNYSKIISTIETEFTIKFR